MAGTRTKIITGGGVRDDRPKRRKSKSSKAPVPVRFWFTVGMAASVLTFVMSGTSNTAKSSLTQSGAMYHVEEQKEPVFDFYTVLPQSEVVVSDGSNSRASVPLRPAPKPVVVKQEPAPETATSKPVEIRPEPVVASVPTVSIPDNPPSVQKPVSTVQYLLQVGSFRDTKDADRMRGELLLNGFEPRVQSVTVRGNEEWHRVQLGPFPGKEQAEGARAELTELGIDSILRQQK